MKKSEQKYALVTGGARGIGKSIAQVLLQQGIHVFITATSERTGWWSELDNCELIVCDFTHMAEVEHLVNSLNETPISYLVNNAGIFDNRLLEDNQEDDWKKLFAVNVFVPQQLISKIAPQMRSNGFGRIVNVSSIAATVTRPGAGAYASSKAAVSSLTRTAALEYAADGILVNSICPAYTDTDMLKSLDQETRNSLLAKVPLQKFCQPADVAELAWFLLSEKNQFLTGQNLILDGGVTIQ